MKEIIKTAIEFLVSSRDYILYWVSNQRNISTQEAAYILIAIPAYLLILFVFHKIYRLFLSGSRKRKGAFYLAADTVLYEYQYQKAGEDLGWISGFLQSASYMQSYSLLLEKASLLSEQTQKQLKKSYHAYKFSLKKRAIVAFLLVVFTLGAYKLFLED